MKRFSKLCSTEKMKILSIISSNFEVNLIFLFVKMQFYCKQEPTPQVLPRPQMQRLNNPLQ